MIVNHNLYLQLAFKLAEVNLGKTKLNPSVGSVLVKNNSVISTGTTSENGRPHSEFNALNKKKENFSGTSMYVTLEPCTHYGLTPPCVNIIKRKKIKKIYYPFDDPDYRTFKKAKSFFKANNIEAIKINPKKFKNFYDSYFFNKKNNIPYVSAKIAISNDFFTINKKTKWITNTHSRKIAHLIRSRFDCIVSTSKSINKDNSILNCRINGLNNNKPDLIIIDLNLKLKKNLLLQKLNQKRKTYIITTKENKNRTHTYKKQGYKIIFIESLIDKNDFYFLFKKIYKLGYGRILFETGLIFLNELIKNKLLNNLYVFQNEYKLGKNGLNNASTYHLKRLNFNNLIKVNLNDNKLYEIKLK